MIGRRRILGIVALAAVLQAIGISRTILPAQDGLKFIRIARAFQHQPALEVIRGSDRHPLYPALVALAEPLFACFAGDSPTTWRITAQLVAAAAAIAAIFPLYLLARGLFGPRIGALAVLLYVLLPLPAEVGRDTLSDSLGLLATLWALVLGAKALETGDTAAYAGCGFAAGVGYLARPEVALVPLAVGLALLATRRFPRTLAAPAPAHETAAARAGVGLSALGVAFLTFVGGYALAKGEVSEKLAIKYGTGIGQPRPHLRRARPWLPRGLDDPRWDFSPKEETLAGEGSPRARPRTSAAIRELVSRWAEGLGGFLGLFALWGALRARAARRLDDDAAEAVQDRVPVRLRALLTIYLVVYSAALVRHMTLLGYLSDRHLLPLVAVALPWTAAGLVLCGHRLADILGWGTRRRRWVGAGMLVLATALAVAAPQWKPGHRSRWGHWAAGRWLRQQGDPQGAVLDTRGWAAFVSGMPSYDYWHVRQALTDPHLAYVVVGEDERQAASRRGATLRAILAYSATPVAAFPDDQGGTTVGVRVYRYHQPSSWEGLRP